MPKSEVLWRINPVPIFRLPKSHKRFLVLLRYICSDDGRIRAFRQQTNKAAPIRDIWNLNESLAKLYHLHKKFTVDEQLFPYRGRPKFKQYIPSKPSKYGIKIWWACDAKTKHPLERIVYTGRQEQKSVKPNNVKMYCCSFQIGTLNFLTLIFSSRIRR